MKSPHNSSLVGWLPLFCAMILLPFSGKSEGIPEPGKVFYGTVRDGATGALVTSGYLQLICTETAAPFRSVTNVVPLQALSGGFCYVTEVPLASSVPGHTVTNDGQALELPAFNAALRNLTRQGRFEQSAATLVQGSADTLSYTNKGALQRLDLVITGADTDNDGMPDWWERQFFGGLSRGGSGDLDGDGISDLAEYLAGTDPNNPSSFFKVTGLSMAAGQITLRWVGPAERTNSVLRSTNVGQSFQVVVPSVAPAAGERTATVPVSGSAQEFFRVRAD